MYVYVYIYIYTHIYLSLSLSFWLLTLTTAPLTLNLPETVRTPLWEDPVPGAKARISKGVGRPCATPI